MNFTDYVPWPETRFQIGWWVLYQIYFNIGVNAMLIVLLLTKQVLRSLRRRRMIS